MSDPRSAYQARVERFEGERRRLERRSRLVSNARLLAFGALIVLALWTEERPAALPYLLTVGALAGFVALVVHHQTLRRRERWFEDARDLNAQGLRRLERDWDRLPRWRAPAGLEEHAYAVDMDVFGHASLTQLLGPAGTPGGRQALSSWLMSAAPPAEVLERQRAVRDLAARNEVRDAVSVHGRRASGVNPAEVEAFLEWAEGTPWLLERRWLSALAWILPPAHVLFIWLDVVGHVDRPLWLLSFGAALVLSFAGPGSRARATFEAAFAREGIFKHYPDMLQAVAAESFEAPRLERLRATFTEGEVVPAEHFGTLRRLMRHSELRHSGMLYLPVQLLTMWDFHVLASLERWQRRSGERVRAWLAALAEFEALSSLAVLSHDHPDWAYPEFAAPDHERVLEATSLGHPLLPEEGRVHNDVRVGPPGTFLLVTGSNMSGKSTLLRAVGTNVILAHAGAPVCAGSLRLPPVVLHTSIRVQDSLARGVSYFMAELERLKQIVDAADAVAGRGPVLLYLLDEILQGTNTAERQVASRRIIRHLIDSGAIGAVTTHDLELAEGPELRDAAAPVHFTETVGTDDDGPAMSFDYRLRPGIATSTNALRLMEIVGLGPADPDGFPAPPASG